MIKINRTQQKHFRTLGHELNPVVTIAGNGLSEPVLAELERALADHELIKVRIQDKNRVDRDATYQTLLQLTGAILIQRIGNVALLYRPNVVNSKNT